MEKKPDPYEEMMANLMKQHDDVTLYYIRQNGVLKPIMEKRHDLQFIFDPETGQSMPQTICKIIYDVDDNGMPLGRITDAACCKFGCKVRADSIVVCRLCRASLCRRHAFHIGENSFCKKGWCRILGRFWQVIRAVFLVLRFCIRSVTGLNADR